MKIPLRFIVIRRGCPHCHLALQAVNFINPYLSYEKRILIVDNFQWEEFGYLLNPFVKSKLDKSFDGYPYIYIDKGIIQPAPMPCLIFTIAKKVAHDLLMEVKYDGKSIYPEKIIEMKGGRE